MHRWSTCRWCDATETKMSICMQMVCFHPRQHPTIHLIHLPTQHRQCIEINLFDFKCCINLRICSYCTWSFYEINSIWKHFGQSSWLLQCKHLDDDCSPTDGFPHHPWPSLACPWSMLGLTAICGSFMVFLWLMHGHISFVFAFNTMATLSGSNQLPLIDNNHSWKCCIHLQPLRQQSLSAKLLSLWAPPLEGPTLHVIWTNHPSPRKLHIITTLEQMRNNFFCMLPSQESFQSGSKQWFLTSGFDWP